MTMLGSALSEADTPGTSGVKSGWPSGCLLLTAMREPGEAGPLDFSDAMEWRRWLQHNHAKSAGEWVYMYKKAAKSGLHYREALDEALCFGWIDGQVKAVDTDRFRQRWTPRRPGSIWSRVNKAKVKRLSAEGRMAQAGLSAVRAAKKAGRWQIAYSNERPPDAHPDLQSALDADPAAKAGFDRLAPSYRRIYCGWVWAAKQEATRARRIAAVLRRAREGRKPGTDSLYD
jgi:uncharacterized protein YdeI (YjbR/CyaY-like superfamily)